MSKSMFITWERHQRTSSLCRELEIEKIELIVNKSRWIRYPILMYRTTKLLLKRKPTTLIVQNPSIVLASLSVTLKSIFKYKLVVDAHNEAIEPYINNYKLFRWISLWILKHSDLTIVTNKYLADKVEGVGAVSLVVPDFLPEMEERNDRECSDIKSSERKITAVLICSYAKDEPFLEVFQALNDMKNSVTLYVTGKVPKWFKSEHVPENVSILGFLPDEDYIETLRRADVIIDLTMMPNCLVCGAYEALALSKPMILSSGKANEEVFPCAVLTDNNAKSISDNLKFTIDNLSTLLDRTELYKENYKNNQKLIADKLLRQIK